MHERYWGRNDSTLQVLVSSSGLIDTPPHAEALARLTYLIEHRLRFGLMFGPTGTGKSLVLRTAAGEAKRLGREVVLLDLLGIDSHDLLWQLAVSLRLGPTERWSHAALWRAVTDHWQALYAARISNVLLLDHLERAEADCVNMIERWLHLEIANDGGLTILAAARKDVDGLLLSELTEQSDLRIELPFLDRHETATFVRDWLIQTGRPHELFHRDAIETLFDLTSGSPREIVRLCQLAFLAADRDDLDRIDSVVLLDLASELPRPHRKPAAQVFSAAR